MSRRLPRELHPLAWWLWAVGLAAAASLTTNPLTLLLLVVVVACVVSLRRTDHPWARSFRFYLWLGAVAVVLRVLWRVLLGGYPGTVLVDLPEIPLPDAVLGIRLLGPLTREALLSGLYDGLRLATIVICIGAANSLANPKRLLRSLPPALYEVGTALAVAVTVLPQFTQSLARVRAAQALRAGETRRVHGLRRLVVPVLEDTLERSLALAAGMDTRGYGRSGGLDPRRRRVSGALLLGALAGLLVGTYAFLDPTAPRWLAAGGLLLGLLAAAGGFRSAGRRVVRTRYRPDPWRWPETGVAAAGLGAGVVAWWVGREQVGIAYPEFDVVPQVSLVALLGTLLGLLAIAVSPLPRAPETAGDPAAPPTDSPSLPRERIRT